MNMSRRVFFAFALILCVFFAHVSVAHAATFFLSPSSGSVAVGKTFTVNVMVNSSDQASNGYTGAVTYPAGLIELTGIAKGGSIVSLWVQEPSFTDGRANFEGVTFHPGYAGAAGKIVSLTFKAKAAGSANIRMASGSILANDGQGTNILKGLGTATYTVGEVETAPAAPAVPGRPAAPTVTSPTHATPTAWYAANDATFRWPLASGVDAVNILADRNPTSDPGTSPEGLFSSYTYENVEDGNWFFHIRVRNAAGWSSPAHFPFNIDTRKPEPFTVTEIPGQDPRAFRFEAMDAGSGIDRFDVRIDDGDSRSWKDDGSHLYRVPDLLPGKHRLDVSALDRAGNAANASIEFDVSATEEPVITIYPRNPRPGDLLAVGGSAIPEAEIRLRIQQGRAAATEATVWAGYDGRFHYVAEIPLETGKYLVWIEGTETAPIILDVHMPSDAPFRFFLIAVLLLILFLLAVHIYPSLKRRKI